MDNALLCENELEISTGYRRKHRQIRGERGDTRLDIINNTNNENKYLINSMQSDLFSLFEMIT